MNVIEIRHLICHVTKYDYVTLACCLPGGLDQNQSLMSSGNDCGAQRLRLPNKTDDMKNQEEQSNNAALRGQFSSTALLSERPHDACEAVALSVFSGSGISLSCMCEKMLCRVSQRQAAGEDLVDARMASKV